MKNWHYAFIVFLGGCSYGVLSTFVKLAYAAGFAPSQVIGGQYLFGTILIWSIYLLTKKKRLPLKKVLQFLLSGIPVGLTGVFYYQSLQTLNASLAIIFLFQFVWIGSIFEWILHKKKPTKSKLISIAILMIGSVLAANLISLKDGGFSWQGTVWGLLSAVTYTAFIFLSSSVEKDTPPVLKSALFSTGASIVVFLLFPPQFVSDFTILRALAPYGFLLGLFGVALPPLLFSIGMPRVGSGLGTILTASELPVAIILSSFILLEPVNGMQWAGVLLILAAIIAGNLSIQKNPNKPFSDTQKNRE